MDTHRVPLNWIVHDENYNIWNCFRGPLVLHFELFWVLRATKVPQNAVGKRSWPLLNYMSVRNPFKGNKTTAMFSHAIIFPEYNVTSKKPLKSNVSLVLSFSYPVPCFALN